jgi:hypothetical protein
MCTDIINLCNSYLPYESIFKIYKGNHKLRNKILEIYKISLPTINNASENGHLDVVKFLHSIEAKVSSWTIDCARRYGHSEIAEFLQSKGY